jgi:hypothetical protein
VWSREGFSGGYVGAGGHFAFSPNLSSGVQVVSPNGGVLWTQFYLPIGVLDVAVGRDASVVIVGATFEFGLSPIPVIYRFEGDGTLAWTKSFPDAVVKTHVNTSIAIDAQNGVWLVFNADTPSDVGGGVFGDATNTMRWSHFARDGSLRGTGVFPFDAIDSVEIPTVKDPTALPQGGIAMFVDGRLEAFNDNGQPMWTLESVQDFVVYDDGSLSVRTDTDTVVRYDAQRTERWRVTGNRVLDHTGTADGGVIFVDSDGLGQSQDISVVTRVTIEGTITRETINTPLLTIVRGPPSNGYVMHCMDCGSVDLNDRTIDIPIALSAYIKREL